MDLTKQACEEADKFLDLNNPWFNETFNTLYGLRAECRRALVAYILTGEQPPCGNEGYVVMKFKEYRRDMAKGPVDHVDDLHLHDDLLPPDVSDGIRFGSKERAMAWTKKPPTEGDWYWHWNGDPECAPTPTSVLTTRDKDGSWKGFVTMGQLGLTSPIMCEDYGGWWLRMKAPVCPSERT